jgi:hypothetical protein
MRVGKKRRKRKANLGKNDGACEAKREEIKR